MRDTAVFMAQSSFHIWGIKSHQVKTKETFIEGIYFKLLKSANVIHI